MPALVICNVCGACGGILRRARCLQPMFCRACGACGEEGDACNPSFTEPAVPATRTRMPATHVLLLCLRRQRGCLQPTFCRACGACGARRVCLQPMFCRACGACEYQGGACNPHFAVPAVPASTARMPAAHVLPCLRCLRSTKGMPATHILQCLRCLRWRRRCLQPIFCRACGACENGEHACSPHHACGADDEYVCATQ